MHGPLFPSLPSAERTRPALAFPDRCLTYGQLFDAACAVAATTTGMGRVAVLAEARIETCVAVIGALLAGTPVVPLNPKSGREELTHILGNAEPDAVLTGVGADVPPQMRRLPAILIDLAQPTRPTFAATEPSPEAPALVIYTSGTTGPPKGVVLPRRAIATNIDALSQVWGWTARDVVVHALPLFHVHGLVLGILGPIRIGGTTRHLGRFSPTATDRALDGDATMLFGVPTMYRRLADAAEEEPVLARALARARLLVSGSAALPLPEHERFERLTGGRVVERYGMTETLMNTAIPAAGDRRVGFVGPPLAGVELRLVDDTGAELWVGDETIGEIQVRGPNLFLGYLNQPDVTTQAMHDGWFRTGDLATVSADGYVRIVGRRGNDLIKSGGFKIGAGEIETALRGHPAVDDAAVTGEPDDDLGERVVAWVVVRTGVAVAERELIDHVANTLAPHKRPRVVRFVPDLPRNELGKVQKKRLGSPTDVRP